MAQGCRLSNTLELLRIWLTREPPLTIGCFGSGVRVGRRRRRRGLRPAKSRLCTSASNREKPCLRASSPARLSRAYLEPSSSLKDSSIGKRWAFVLASRSSVRPGEAQSTYDSSTRTSVIAATATFSRSNRDRLRTITLAPSNSMLLPMRGAIQNSAKTEITRTSNSPQSEGVDGGTVAPE